MTSSTSIKPTLAFLPAIAYAHTWRFAVPLDKNKPRRRKALAKSLKRLVSTVLVGKRTTLRIPTWSPTVVLTEPEHA